MLKAIILIMLIFVDNIVLQSYITECVIVVQTKLMQCSGIAVVHRDIEYNQPKKL